MNIDDLRNLLNAHGICEKLDDFDNRGLPDLALYSGGHCIFIFTEWTEQQQAFAKRISHQLAPHFIWIHTHDYGLKQFDSIVQAVPINTPEHIVEWLDYIEEENKDFDYLAKYSEES